jgi:hypothetical protein
MPSTPGRTNELEKQSAESTNPIPNAGAAAQKTRDPRFPGMIIAFVRNHIPQGVYEETTALALNQFSTLAYPPLATLSPAAIVPKTHASHPARISEKTAKARFDGRRGLAISTLNPIARQRIAAASVRSCIGKAGVIERTRCWRGYLIVSGDQQPRRVEREALSLSVGKLPKIRLIRWDGGVGLWRLVDASERRAGDRRFPRWGSLLKVPGRSARRVPRAPCPKCPHVRSRPAAVMVSFA